MKNQYEYKTDVYIAIYPEIMRRPMALGIKFVSIPYVSLEAVAWSPCNVAREIKVVDPDQSPKTYGRITDGIRNRDSGTIMGGVRDYINAACITDRTRFQGFTELCTLPCYREGFSPMGEDALLFLQPDKNDPEPGAVQEVRCWDRIPKEKTDRLYQKLAVGKILK